MIVHAACINHFYWAFLKFYRWAAQSLAGAQRSNCIKIVTATSYGHCSHHHNLLRGRGDSSSFIPFPTFPRVKPQVPQFIYSNLHWLFFWHKLKNPCAFYPNSSWGLWYGGGGHHHFHPSLVHSSPHPPLPFLYLEKPLPPLHLLWLVVQGLLPGAEAQQRWHGPSAGGGSCGVIVLYGHVHNYF